jgi:ABC-2 type transport system ATP-binding protein
MTLAEPAIQVEHLVKVYGERSSNPVRALEGISLTVRRGEIYGLLGQNGAGKTTLLRILTTLTQPTSGTARLLGLDVARQGYEVRKQICAVLQENAVEIFLSVEDNLDTYGRFHSLPRAEIGRRANRVIAQFGLEDHRRQKVIDLSGGLKRRVQVAKVFMVDKPVVFLDEATTGMDPINKRATLDAIREQARQGRTIFLTTHMLDEAEELCDTIAIIDHGRCVAIGDPEKIKSLGSRVVEIRITYASLAPDPLGPLQRFALHRLELKNATIELAVDANEVSPFEVLNVLGTLGPVINLEVTGGSLEDAFIELLGKGSGPGPAPWRDRS